MCTDRGQVLRTFAHNITHHHPLSIINIMPTMFDVILTPNDIIRPTTDTTLITTQSDVMSEVGGPERQRHPNIAQSALLNTFSPIILIEYSFSFSSSYFSSHPHRLSIQELYCEPSHIFGRRPVVLQSVTLN